MRLPVARSCVTWLALSLVAATLASVGCGGAANAPASEPGGGKTQVEGAAEGAEPGPAEQAEGVACADGSCIPCGDGICFEGYYCDQSSGSAGCGWLAECAERATCECIQAKLGPTCTCTERGGFASVSCD